MAIDIKKIEKLFTSYSSGTMFKEALFEILPERKRWVSFVIFGVFSAISAGLIGFSNDTIDLFYKAISNLNNIILYLFAIVFTGYTLFQALMNNDLLKRLITTEGKSANSSKGPTINNETGKSKLQESNEYFVKVMMLMVSAIVINSLLLLLMGSLPNDFSLPIRNIFNNALAAVSICIYFVYMILIIWEMKSFVFNMFQLFNAHAGSKAIELLKSQDEE